MSEIQDQLREWMAAGFEKKGRGSKRELATTLGIQESAISKILKGEKGKGHQKIDLAWIPLMERYFGMEAPIGVTMKDTEVPPPTKVKRPSIAPNIGPAFPTPELPPRLIPVYGVAVGGDDGRMKFNGERLDMVGSPPQLRNVPDAYAVYVSGESMVPSFKPGHMAWVNPNMAPRPGDDVIVQLHAEDGEAPEGFIKELVKRTASKLVVKQYNPAMEIEFDLAVVKSVHVVVFNSRR